MDPNEKGKGSARREGEEAERRRAESDPGPGASERQQEIGPSGGPPSDEQRQWRGATPSEDVMERVIQQHGPGEKTPELGEPDSGASDAGGKTE